MDIEDLFEGLLVFIIEEAIIGALWGSIWYFVNSDIELFNKLGYSFVDPLLILLLVIILAIPVILHRDDLREFF